METSVRNGREVIRRRSGRQKFTVALRSQLLDRIIAMQAAGSSREEIAKSLGISPTSVRRWTEAATAASSRNEASTPVTVSRLAAVEVRQEATARAVVVTVSGPRGLRVEGLTMEQLAELIARLE